MDWKELTDINQLDEIDVDSAKKPIAIFKHSTRCGISMAVKRKFEAEVDQLETKPDIYYLDLLNHRDISDEIAQRYAVPHQSPQLLLIKGGKSKYDASHHHIEADLLEEQL